MQALEELFRDFKETELPPITDDSALMEIGLDSLDYAVLVTRLHDELGVDPFTLSTDSYYPTTFGELVSFYGRFVSP